LVDDAAKSAVATREAITSEVCAAWVVFHLRMTKAVDLKVRP
jgi:hypothetical protein